MKKLLFLSLLVASSVFAQTPTPTPTATPSPTPYHVGQTFTVAWDKNTESDIASYTIGYGVTSGIYTTLVSVATGLTNNPVTWAFTNFPLGTWKMAVKAINTGGQNSPWSTEITATVTLGIPPAAPKNLKITSGFITYLPPFNARDILWTQRGLVSNP